MMRRTQDAMRRSRDEGRLADWSYNFISVDNIEIRALINI